MNNLTRYGAGERHFSEATLYPAWHLARVASQHKGRYRVVTEQSEGLAEVSGRFQHEAAAPSEFPAVGDFVMVDRLDMQSGNAIIHQRLTRSSVFERAAVGVEGQTQVVAANLDYALLCMSLQSDYRLSRLERYLSVAWSSGATPVVVLTKADLCDELPERLAEVHAVALGAQVLVTSRFDAASYEPLRTLLRTGVTAGFIGSSGVGKSTLINALLGEELLATAEVREDGKGRHTSTRRELLPLPGGGVVIDTPGMRELGVDSVDLHRTFADLDELAQRCRFRDCSHGGEPGCAVLAAIAAGELDERRLESWRKLQKEARYEGLSSRQIEETKLNEMFGSVGGMKAARDYLKHKNKRRYE